MSRRFLAIMIEANELSCGDCWYGKHVGNGCYLWHDKTREEGSKGFHRLPECKDAERLSRKTSG